MLALPAKGVVVGQCAGVNPSEACGNASARGRKLGVCRTQRGAGGRERGVVLKWLRRVSAENQKLQKRTSRNAGAKNEKHDI